MKDAVVFLVITVLAWPCPASGESLLMVYPDRPPYNYTVDGKAVGILVERTEKILLDAGLTPNFSEMPPSRIFVELQKEGSQVCTFGGFKNSKREAFATFSLPMYQDSPLVALFLTENASLFQNKSSLKELIADKSLTLGVVAGFSYGRAVDAILTDAKPPLVVVSQQQLGAMLALKRFSYMLIRPVEVDELVKQSGKAPEEFMALSMSDVQDRNKRYILCGKGVPADILARINASISKNCTLD